jgi:hypothetical protein
MPVTPEEEVNSPVVARGGWIIIYILAPSGGNL